jgi:hypothetical protein
VNADPPPIHGRRPDVPAPLEEIMRRAMSKSPDARPTAKEFRRLLLAAAGESW